MLGPEKELIHTALIMNNPNILDLEIVEGGRACRMDVAAVRGTLDRPEIVHYEAKDVTNPEFFAKHPGELPQVLEQLTRYDRLIAEHGVLLRRRYMKLAEAALDLGLTPCFQRGIPASKGQHRIDESILKTIAGGSFVLSPHAILVVLGWSRAPSARVKVAVEKLEREHGRVVLKFGTQGQRGISKN